MFFLDIIGSIKSFGSIKNQIAFFLLMIFFSVIIGITPAVLGFSRLWKSQWRGWIDHWGCPRCYCMIDHFVSYLLNYINYLIQSTCWKCLVDRCLSPFSVIASVFFWHWWASMDAFCLLYMSFHSLEFLMFMLSYPVNFAWILMNHV